MIWAIIWYWLLTVFTVADIITTRIGLSLGAHEANPMMAPVLDHIIEVKMLYLLAMIAAILIIECHSKGSGWLPPAACTCVTFIATLSNINQIRSLV